MIIKTLHQLSCDDLERLTEGYRSHQAYHIHRNESDADTVFRLNLVALNTPYNKRFEPDEPGEYKRYCGYLDHGMSLGLYREDRLEGLAIAEPVRWNKTLWIWEFHIAPSYRGRGWGRKMMDELAHRASEAGLRIMVCETQNTNVPAIRFYRSVGFTMDGIDLTYYSNDAMPDGEIAVFMKRRLDDGPGTTEEKVNASSLYPDDPHSRLETAPACADEIRRRHAANRAAWNEGAGKYTKALGETAAGIRAGQSNMHPLERRNLGNLEPWCHTAIHLQCASGGDTLSLVLEGAKRVIGVDISDVHIENARQLSRDTGIPAEWYRCDVLDTPEKLNGIADLVYTGRGAICWIQDLDAWAAVICRLLKPGGIFHILDDHPFVWLFRQDVPDLQVTAVKYLDHCESNKGWSESYLGNLGMPVAEESRKYERLWPLGRLVQALVDAGLEILCLGEHAETYWNNMPLLEEQYRQQIPMTFSIKARKRRDQTPVS